MNRKIGPLLLSGLMIGPILGSGVVLLPPMAYGMIGRGAIWAWLMIMGLGALFAMIFSRLAVLHPGDGGMTNAIEESLGKKMKLYASLLMISAVSFGPTAVMLTASEYLNKLPGLSRISTPGIALALVILSFGFLMRDVKFISTVSFALSSVIAVTLIISSGVVIFQQGIQIEPARTVVLHDMGRVVLLLFWAIIGWEIVGNYSGQVKDLERTIPFATWISVIVITATYLVIALAVQSFEYTDELSLVDVITPVFRGASTWLLAVLVTGLCFSTYLLIVGALSRLVSALASEGYLPQLFSDKNANGVPFNGVRYFTAVHCTVLVLSILGALNLEGIVAIANGFFLMNAVIGLIAAMRIVKSWFYKLSSLVLAISLGVILIFSSVEIFIALIGVLVLALLMERRKNMELQSE